MRMELGTKIIQTGFRKQTFKFECSKLLFFQMLVIFVSNIETDDYPIDEESKNGKNLRNEVWRTVKNENLPFRKPNRRIAASSA